MSKSKMNLKELIEFASASAGKIFRATGVIYPMYHCITASGETLIMQPPGIDKDIDVALMKAAFELQDVDTVLYLDEAWILDDRNGQMGIDIERAQREGISNHPDRREVVMFAAENRKGEMQTARRYILRPEHGKAKLAPLEIDDMSVMTQSSGRMVGLLKRVK